tara:strand:+ start:97 stop:630 length:534 start_codon:yes stop_codon:yes gene_type:complete
MNLQNVNYVPIDADGEMVDEHFITPDNIFYIMGGVDWSFTEEEVRAKGFAPVWDSIRNVVNGDTDVDVEPGNIVKDEDGNFTQEWDESTISILEKRYRFMERTRSNLLPASDWTQLADAALSDEDQAAWATYRQALRDLPSTIDWDTISSADEIVWPLLPGVTIPDPGEPDPVDPDD